MSAMKKILVAISAAASMDEFKDDSTYQALFAEVQSIIQEMKQFMGASTNTDEQGRISFAGIANCVGDATIAQSLYRELKTGETRQSLVNKASAGVKKRGWRVHANLTSRCNAILSGKPVSK